jgi:hypothetical protein
MTKKKTTTKKVELPVQEGRYRVQFDFTYKGAPGKKMSDEIVTQPDMTLTVRQLLENHTRGIDSGVQEKAPFYFDVEVPTITDITDVHEYRDYLNERIQQVNEFIANERADQEEDPNRVETDPDTEENNSTNN